MFVGADPMRLAGLADIVDQYAARLGLMGSEVTDTVRRQSGAATCRALSRLERDLGERAEELRWRAAAIEEAQQVGMPLLVAFGLHRSRLAEFAALAVFDLGGWERAYARWRTTPSTSQLLKMDPAEVANAIAEVAPSVAEDLTRRNPRVIGGLDGVPPELRYRANRILIAAEIAGLERQISMVQNPQPATGVGSSAFSIKIAGFAIPALVATAAAALAERADEYRRWLEEDRQILLFAPVGDGRVVEVFGDLTNATRVAVVISGMSNSIDNFSSDEGGFRANAAILFDASQTTDDIATVAWLGYDTPDSVGAAVRARAEDGVPHLRRFLEGIDPNDEKIVTVVAHSYGSVVAGLAAGGGIAANNLVFVGSPGTTLDRAGDAVLRPGGRVWAGLAEDDPIAWGIAPSELPTWPLVPTPIGYLMGIVGAFHDADDLWHGTNPASDEFGALRIGTEGASGHSDYFESGSLGNLALIVEGRYSEVGLAS